MGKNRNMDDIFDLLSFKTVYGTTGARVDYVRQSAFNVDADAAAEALVGFLTSEAPLIVLEGSYVATGAAQNMDLIAPAIGDPNIADESRIVAVDVSFQLNDDNTPMTDFKFELQFLDCYGQAQVPRSNYVEGTAAIMDGDTRQSLRMMPAHNLVVSSAAGATSVQDGKTPSFPRFQRADFAAIQLLATGTGLTIAQLRLIFPNFSQDVATVRLAVPPSGITAGVTVTMGVVTIGRLDEVAEIVRSLDHAGDLSATNTLDRGFAALLGGLKS